MALMRLHALFENAKETFWIINVIIRSRMLFMQGTAGQHHFSTTGQDLREQTASLSDSTNCDTENDGEQPRAGTSRLEGHLAAMLPANASASMKAGIMDSMHEWRNVDLLLPILPVSNAAAFSLQQAALLEQGACQPHIAFASDWPPSHLIAARHEARWDPRRPGIKKNDCSLVSPSCRGNLHNDSSCSSSCIPGDCRSDVQSCPASYANGSSHEASQADNPNRQSDGAAVFSSSSSSSSSSSGTKLAYLMDSWYHVLRPIILLSRQSMHLLESCMAWAMTMLRVVRDWLAWCLLASARVSSLAEPLWMRYFSWLLEGELGPSYRCVQVQQPVEPSIQDVLLEELWGLLKQPGPVAAAA